MDEFRIIDEIFKPLAGKGAPAFHLENDTAIYTPPEHMDLVLTKDVLIEGTHFLADQDPAVVARRLLAANLSDLAASGAMPVGYLLGIMAAKTADEKWLKGFARGLREAQNHAAITLFGGDTTSGSKTLCLSLTALGLVEKGRGLSRFGARPGDLVFVSGTIGDAYLGLRALKGEGQKNKYLVSRFSHPSPRIALGEGLLGLAGATIDISDGLVADAGHLAEASKVKTVILLDKIPFSKEARATKTDPVKLITAGDDLELLFTVPPEKKNQIGELSERLGLTLTEIGRIIEGRGVDVLDRKNKKVEIGSAGYRHFK